MHEGVRVAVLHTVQPLELCDGPVPPNASSLEDTRPPCRRAAPRPSCGIWFCDVCSPAERRSSDARPACRVTAEAPRPPEPNACAAPLQPPQHPLRLGLGVLRVLRVPCSGTPAVVCAQSCCVRLVPWLPSGFAPWLLEACCVQRSVPFPRTSIGLSVEEREVPFVWLKKTKVCR